MKVRKSENRFIGKIFSLENDQTNLILYQIKSDFSNRNSLTDGMDGGEGRTDGLFFIEMTVFRVQK